MFEITLYKADFNRLDIWEGIVDQFGFHSSADCIEITIAAASVLEYACDCGEAVKIAGAVCEDCRQTLEEM